MRYEFKLMRRVEFDITNAETNTFAYNIKVNSDSDEKHYQITAYPSKQVVGMLKYEGNRKKAKVTFEVFDNQTQQWKIDAALTSAETDGTRYQYRTVSYRNETV
jgi:hypothetical protein